MSAEHALPINIQDHLRQEQRLHPEATGALTSILTDFARVAKSISRLVTTAGIQDAYGKTGTRNASGEEVVKLDFLANEQFKQRLRCNPHVAGYASEEEDDFVAFDNKNGDSKYVVWFDPLDGSSNFDTNIPIGSIFSIYKRASDHTGPVNKNDFLQPGSRQVCSGYFLYGSSTMFVYTTGHGVFGFTLDPEGEFVLPQVYDQIKTPPRGRIYSINEAYSPSWLPPVPEYIHELKTRKIDQCTGRYVGSLVADFHRNMIKGGVYLYPADHKNPEGKLRLNCELFPLAFVAEQAGGLATNGTDRILDLVPRSLHQRSPLVIGSAEDVKLCARHMQALQTRLRP